MVEGGTRSFYEDHFGATVWPATAAKCPAGIDFDPGLRGVLATMVGEPPEGRSRQNGP